MMPKGHVHAPFRSLRDQVLARRVVCEGIRMAAAVSPAAVDSKRDNDVEVRWSTASSGALVQFNSDNQPATITDCIAQLHSQVLCDAYEVCVLHSITKSKCLWHRMLPGYVRLPRHFSVTHWLHLRSQRGPASVCVYSRSLPSLAQQYVLRLLAVQCLPRMMIDDWCQPASRGIHASAIQRLLDLRVLGESKEAVLQQQAPPAPGQTVWVETLFLNQAFGASLRKALTGSVYYVYRPQPCVG